MLVIKQPSQLEVNRFVIQRNALLDRQCREHASVVGEPQWWRRPEHWVDNRSIGCVKASTAKQNKVQAIDERVRRIR